jgi:hypothetical protein
VRVFLPNCHISHRRLQSVPRNVPSFIVVFYNLGSDSLSVKDDLMEGSVTGCDLVWDTRSATFQDFCSKALVKDFKKRLVVVNSYICQPLLLPFLCVRSFRIFTIHLCFCFLFFVSFSLLVRCVATLWNLLLRMVVGD